MPYVTSVERLGMQKGFEQGLQQGLQQGVQQGLQEGVQQGLQQGLQQGKLQAAREMLLEVVAMRFGGVPDDVLTVVRRLETVEPLHALLRQALTCTSLEAFREALHIVPDA
jgi:flagellar biosynthesis/type III secretory pathway protein FliH